MNNKEVIAVITQGRAFKSGSFLLKIAKNNDNLVKNVAILAPKKQFPTAVLRNKAKRRIRAGIQRFLDGKKTPKDTLFVFTLYKSLLDISSKTFFEEVQQFFGKNDIL